MTCHTIYWLVTTGVPDGTAVHTTHLFNTLISLSLPFLQHVEPRSIIIIILAGSIQRGDREDVKNLCDFQTNTLILKRSSEITLWDLPLVLHLYRLQKGVAWKCCRVGWVGHQWIQYLYSLSLLSVGPGAYGNPPVKRVLVKSSPAETSEGSKRCVYVLFVTKMGALFM